MKFLPWESQLLNQLSREYISSGNDNSDEAPRTKGKMGNQVAYDAYDL